MWQKLAANGGAIAMQIPKEWQRAAVGGGGEWQWVAAGGGGE